VAFDAAVPIGTWDVSVEFVTPLPAALPLFATGIGAMGLLGWRSKRKAQAAALTNNQMNVVGPPRVQQPPQQ
jgi:hypothetical protein